MMQRRRILRWMLMVAVLIASGVHATSVLDRSVEALFTRADRVVYGAVASIEGAVVDGSPVTRVRITVERDLQRADTSDDAGDELTLSFAAGEGPNGLTFVDDLPIPDVGDRVLVAAFTGAPAISPVVGVWQGLWTLQEGGLTDLRGTALGVENDVVTFAGEETDVGTVLDTLERALAGEAPAALSPAPHAQALESANAEPMTPGEAADDATADEAGSADSDPSGAMSEPADDVSTDAEASAASADDAAAEDAAETQEEATAAATSDEAQDDDTQAQAGSAEASEADANVASPTDDADREDGTETASAANPTETGEGVANVDGATADDTMADDAASNEESMLDASEDAREPRVELRISVPEDAALRSAIDSAAEAWRAAGVNLRVIFDELAFDRVLVGTSESFGPDALAFTRRVGGAEGIEILLPPGANGRRIDVLAYELGRLGGLVPSEVGFLSGRFPASDELRPSAADAVALATSLAAVPEDLNGDGFVDFYDLVLLGQAYGTVGTRIVGDLDQSGVVDDADVELLRAAYEFLPAERDAPPGRIPSAP